MSSSSEIDDDAEPQQNNKPVYERCVECKTKIEITPETEQCRLCAAGATSDWDRFHLCEHCVIDCSHCKDVIYCDGCRDYMNIKFVDCKICEKPFCCYYNGSGLVVKDEDKHHSCAYQADVFTKWHGTCTQCVPVDKLPIRLYRCRGCNKKTPLSDVIASKCCPNYRLCHECNAKECQRCHKKAHGCKQHNDGGIGDLRKQNGLDVCHWCLLCSCCLTYERNATKYNPRKIYACDRMYLDDKCRYCTKKCKKKTVTCDEVSPHSYRFMRRYFSK